MNNKLKIIFFSSLLLCTACTTAYSQAQCTFAKQGTFELGGNLSYNHIYLTSNFTIAPYIGWFPIDGFEIAFDPIEFSMIGDQRLPQSYIYVHSQTSLMVLFAPSYNYKFTNRSFLFFEGLIGYIHVSQNASYNGPCEACDTGPYTVSDSGIVYGGHIGVKVAISNHALFNIGVQYLRTVYPAEPAITFGYNDLSLVAGFTVVL